MHEGLTCEEYAEFRHMDPTEAAFAGWKKRNDVRACPKEGCGAPIEKISGCNHMKCSVCKTHICWVCMAMVPADKIYAHMDNAHGGWGLN